MTTHLKPGDRVKTTDGPGTVRAVADLDVSAQAWFGNAELCVVLDCGSKFPFNFIPKAQRDPPPLSVTNEIANRLLTREMVAGICDRPDLCWEYNKTARCGPCALQLHALASYRAVRYLTGIGEFDTNDPCDEWPAP